MDKYKTDDPLAMVVEFLEKQNKDSLASDVIDVFADVTQQAAENNQYAVALEQFNLIAKLYLDVRNIPKAEKYALRVLGMSNTKEQTYNARANLGKLYNNVNQPEKALFHSKLNNIAFPNDPDTLMEMVFSYYLLAQKDEAEKILRYLKQNEDKLSERHQDIVNFNLGTYDLEKGMFNEGLRGFMLKGKKLKLWFSHRELPYKFWDGGAFPGKTLILFAEGGGIGDEMLSIRFMDDLKAVGFKPLFYTSRKDLYDLFNENGYETIMNLDGIPKDAMWTYFMQVPIYLNSKPEKVLREKYLLPNQKARDKWSFIKESKKIKIGVRWQGNSKNERDLHRKVPLDDIMRYVNQFKTDDIELYSLQIGDGIEEIQKYPELIDVSDKIQSYNDTLALLENLDYVITSCTSVLHASAAVGTKTLALIPISAYFTWVSPPTPGRPKNTSIWYGDNLRVFKQSVPHSWNEPLVELIDYLKAEL